MATEVLLITDVKDLGVEGDVVTVADGFARNYLLPQKLAAPVTEETRRKLAKTKVEREKKREAARATAAVKAAELAKVSVTITVKTGGEDKMYGSVSAVDIVKALAQQGVELDKQALELDKPIKELGVFDVKVNLHPDVAATVKVWVVEE